MFKVLLFFSYFLLVLVCISWFIAGVLYYIFFISYKFSFFIFIGYDEGRKDGVVIESSFFLLKKGGLGRWGMGILLLFLWMVMFI